MSFLDLSLEGRLFKEYLAGENSRVKEDGLWSIITFEQARVPSWPLAPCLSASALWLTG
jgi:hypothetical protein